jgi:type II secretory pathway component PulF
MAIKPTQKPQKQHLINAGNRSVWQMNVSDVILLGRKRKAPAKDLAVLCRKLSYLLVAGLPIKAALPILQGESLGASLGAAVAQVHKRVMKGDSFSDALRMEGVFPEFMVGYISIGEKTAQLATVCEKLADYYERQAQTRQALFAALMYPAGVLVMMFAVVVLAMVTVLPGYARIFESSDIALPAITAVLLSMSAFLSRYAVFVLGSMLLLVVALVAYIRSQRGKKTLAGVALKIPLLRQAVNLQLVQALSLLLGSGVRLSEAVLLCVGLMGNVHVKKDLQALSKKLAEGTAFSVSLASMQYIDPLFKDLTQVGENTGDMPQAMERCFDYFAAEYKHNIARVNKLIEPIITLIVGVLIALVMLAVVLPTFQLAMVM